MVAELVGGAFLSATLQVLFDRLASRQVLNLFKRQKLNDKLLKQLKMLMITVSKVLNDAESKQITDPFVKEWVDELKDAVYEADDFLDEVAYESRRLEVAGSQTSTNHVLEFLSTHNPFEREKAEMEAKLEEVLERLVDLIQQKDALGLREGIEEKPSAAQKMPTTSLLDEHAVYGREGDKEAIMKLVLSEDANGRQLDVIPIVGMGGVGKTTLAQLVYNDSRVQKQFDLKAWVCVSEEFDSLKLTKDILKEVSPASSATCETMTANQLHCELENKTTGEKVLLVLDDVWSENQEVWHSLFIPLKSVRQGSKIIVTTRNDSAAQVKSTVPIHHLQKLTEDDCWLVFAKQAFDYGSSSAHLDFEEIGREIVRKCDGLPLAAKALGGLLRSKRDAKEWEKVLKSELWNSPKGPILPALTLSYYYLPSQLKQCFSYCSIFPNDFQFNKDELIRLWMAEGFLVPPKGEEVIEDVGEDCFLDLASRSFFQRYSSDGPSLFVMHDLIHDLAKFVSGEFCFLLEDDDSTKIAEKARHFSYIPTNYDASPKFAVIYEAELLRTFLPLSERWQDNRVEDEVIHDLLQRFKRLRVLSLPGYSRVAELSDSMGKLKHLRYLNLRSTSIKELPEVVGIAYNLQSLILEDCRELVELPESIGNLKYLRYANLRETAIKRLPASMGCLYNLQTLILECCYQLVELPDSIGNLNHLLHANLKNTAIKQLPASMGYLYNLQTLILEACRELVELPDSIGNLKNLRYANLKNTAIKRLPASLGCLYNLQTLILEFCYQLIELPDSIGNLKRLLYMTLGYTEIKRLPESLSDLYNLQTLILQGCFNLRELPTGMGRLTNLCHLDIRSTKLSEMPSGMDKLTKLLKLTDFFIGKQSGSSIKELGKLQHLQGSLCIWNLQNVVNDQNAAEADLKGKKQLEGLQLRWNGDTDDSQHERNVLEKLEPHANLKSLKINGYGYTTFPDWMGVINVDCSTSLEEIDVGKNLESFRLHERSIGSFTYLSELSIYNCPNIVSFPLPAPNLRELELWNCTKLKWLPERMHFLLPSLEYLSLKELPEVESFPEGGLPPKLHSLFISICNKLIAGGMEWNLQSHPSLSDFRIAMNEEVESFPENSMLPSTLTRLDISHLKNMKALNEGIQQLTSLRELNISFCPELQSMPKEGLPSSLCCLEIFRCPLLENKCVKDTGEDWHKISHISDIVINGYKIN